MRVRELHLMFMGGFATMSFIGVWWGEYLLATIAFLFFCVSALILD